MGKINKNYLNLDKKIENIENLLAEDEKILWQGSPNKSAYFWTRFLNKLQFVIIWLVVDITFIAVLIASKVTFPIPVIIALCAFFALHLIPVWIWIYGLVKARKNSESLKYYISSQRVIISDSTAGLNIYSIYYKEITSINVNISRLDRKYNVGDVYITSTKNTKILEDILEPYEVTATLQKFIGKLNTNFNKDAN